MKLSLFSFVFLFALLLPIYHAGRIAHNNLQLAPGQQSGLRVGLWSLEDAPEGDRNTSISYKLTITRDNKTTTAGRFDILFFHSENSPLIGYFDDDHQRHFCCSPGLIQKGICTTRGELILSEEISGSPTFVNAPIEFQENEFVVKTPKEGQQPIDSIKKSGIYYLYFINCEDSHLGTLFISGSTTWMNPFGHLSADQYYFLPFYGILSLMYIVVALLWFVASALHWTDLLAIQNCIAGVIALGMIEGATWYFEYLSYNLQGQYHVGAIVVGILVSTFKRTVSRLLVLVVSMGYGVVKANLGTTGQRVVWLGGLYFLFSGSFQILSNNSSAEGITTLLVIPVALLDTFFYWWIFLSLVRTISQLTVRKQPIKLDMYKKLFITLIASGIASTAVVVYQLILVLASTVDDRWQMWWMWEAFWHVLYLFVFIAIAILWRPTSNNTRYAYSELKDIDEDDTYKPIPTFSAFGEIIQRVKHNVVDKKGNEAAYTAIPTDSDNNSNNNNNNTPNPNTNANTTNNPNSTVVVINSTSLPPSNSSESKEPSKPIVPAFTLEEDEENRTELSKIE